MRWSASKVSYGLLLISISNLKYITSSHYPWDIDIILKKNLLIDPKSSRYFKKPIDKILIYFITSLNRIKNAILFLGNWKIFRTFMKAFSPLLIFFTGILVGWQEYAISTSGFLFDGIIYVSHHTFGSFKWKLHVRHTICCYQLFLRHFHLGCRLSLFTSIFSTASYKCLWGEPFFPR